MTRPLVTLVLLLATFSSSLGRAQSPDDDLARARVLFREGVGHVEANDLDAAAASFEAALALHDAPSIRFNLASALVELNRFVEAYPHLSMLASDPAVDPPMKQSAEELLARAVERVGRLRVRAVDTIDALTLDGAALPRDRETAVEPGRHLIVGSQNGEAMVERAVEVAAGERTLIDLAVLRVEAAPEAPAVLEDDGRGHVGRNVALIAAAIAIVATTVILAVVLSGGDDELSGDLQPGILRW